MSTAAQQRRALRDATAKVRVCIAVNHRGEWRALGEPGLDAAWHVTALGDGISGNAVFYWAYIDLPVPKPPREVTGGRLLNAKEIARIERDALLHAAKTTKE